MSETSGPGRRGFLQALAGWARAPASPCPREAASQAAHAHAASVPAEAPAGPGLSRREPARDAGVAGRGDRPRLDGRRRRRRSWTACSRTTRRSAAGLPGRARRDPGRVRRPLRKAVARPRARAEDRAAHRRCRRARPHVSRATGSPGAAGAGARAADGAADAARPLRPPQGADRDRLLQLRDGHEGARLDGPADPRRPSRAARTPRGTASNLTRGQPGALTRFRLPEEYRAGHRWPPNAAWLPAPSCVLARRVILPPGGRSALEQPVNLGAD